MNAIPPMAPLPRDQRNIDADHLNLLSIFHFVAAGLALLGILFLMVHYTFMHFMFTNPDLWKNQKQGPPPAEIFHVFIWFYIIFGAWFLVSGVLSVMSGVFLRQRKHRTFSLVVAAINCVHIPAGTVLGAFTIVVLVRQSVVALYKATES